MNVFDCFAIIAFTPFLNWGVIPWLARRNIDFTVRRKLICGFLVAAGYVFTFFQLKIYDSIRFRFRESISICKWFKFSTFF